MINENNFEIEKIKHEFNEFKYSEETRKTDFLLKVQENSNKIIDYAKFWMKWISIAILMTSFIITVIIWLAVYFGHEKYADTLNEVKSEARKYISEISEKELNIAKEKLDIKSTEINKIIDEKYAKRLINQAERNLRKGSTSCDIDYYNLACGYSLLNDFEKAIFNLKRAICADKKEKTNLSIEEVKDDIDFDNIKNKSEFQDLLINYEKLNCDEILRDKHCLSVLIMNETY